MKTLFAIALVMLLAVPAMAADPTYLPIPFPPGFKPSQPTVTATHGAWAPDPWNWYWFEQNARPSTNIEDFRKR
jgi:hypothetical protein